MLAYHLAESIAYGERAVALARAVDDAAVTAHALTNIGISRWVLGDPAGQPTVDEALRVALEAGDVEDACRAYVNLVRNLLDWFRLEEAERYLTAAMKLAEETEFFGILSYMQVMRARLEFARGSWDEAVSRRRSCGRRIPAGEMPGAGRARPGAGPARAAGGRPAAFVGVEAGGADRRAAAARARPRPRARRMPGSAATTPGCATSPHRSTRKPSGWATG